MTPINTVPAINVEIPGADFWGIISSVVSIILGIVAFFVSFYFFKVGKDTEVKTSNLLTEIKTQTDMLQNITGSQLDRLTRYVTEQQTQAEMALPEQIRQSLANPLNAVNQSLQNIATIQDNAAILRREVIDAYIAIYFYTMKSNYWAQMMLPYDQQTYNARDNLSQSAVYATDMSFQDYKKLHDIINQVPEHERTASQFANLLKIATDMNPWVKNAEQVLVSRGIQT